MLKTFETLDELLAEVERDRTMTGAGSATADRFPVRFVLFDNFRDCAQFVDKISIDGKIQVTHIHNWIDKEYPDSLITHKKLADYIHKEIVENPTQYRIVMPFSELARFYNNHPERAEFNALINTIKSFDTSKVGFQHRQRVYIPLVGLEGKMEHFRNDSQSFIWYFKNSDYQMDYHLILTDGTTYGVSGFSGKYEVVSNVYTWLDLWMYHELSKNLIVTSHAIYSHAEYADPDNAFTFAPCKNAYEFLTKGLHLDVDCIPYKDDELEYWEQLAQKIDLNDFKFETFFNQQFGINKLENFEVFYNQWFIHKDLFMRWLLAKYYVHRFCNEGYICRVLQNLNGYSDTAFINSLALTIFKLENPVECLEERRIGLQTAAKYHVELSHDVASQVVSHIEQIEQAQGILSAIPYVSDFTYEEKALVVRWYADDAISKEQLYQLFPDLYHYMKPLEANTTETWVADYMQQYKEAKVRNQYTPEVKEAIETLNKDEVEHFKWSNAFKTTRTLLSSQTDIDFYCWIDGLGVDWVPYIQQIVKEHEIEGYFVNNVYLATAKLPTRTEDNKPDIEAISGNGLVLSKDGDLDEVAHSLRPYPQFVIDDLKTLRESIHKILLEHQGETIAIISDHGISYLPQMLEGCNLKGYKSDHYGRLAFPTGQSNVVSDSKYTILRDDSGKVSTIVALKHESLMAKIPDGMGCHGGATPEEQLVPVIIISNHKTTQIWTCSLVSNEINEADPRVHFSILGLPTDVVPLVEYNKQMYNLTKEGSHYISDRLVLNAQENKVILHVGTQTKIFNVKIKFAVQENELF